MSAPKRVARHKLLRDAVDRLQEIAEEATRLVDEIAVRTRYDGLSIREGIRLCLGANDAPISEHDIASELWLGGVHTGSGDLKRVVANVRTTLRNMRQEGEIRFVPFRGTGKPTGYILADKEGKHH